MTMQASALLSRRALLSAAGLGGLALAAGCGDGRFTQTVGSVPDQYRGRQHIVFWHSYGGPPLKVLEKLAEKFNDAQHDIYVETQFQGSYEATMQKLATAIVARQIPDMVILSEITWRKMHLADTLEPYNDYFDDDLHPDLYIDQFIDEGTVKGKLWWIPFARSTPLFFFNRTLFAKAGLPKSGPTSWEQLLDWTPAIMRQHTRAGHPRVLALASEYASWYLQSNIWTWGGHWSKGLDIAIDSPTNLAAGQWMVDYIRTHHAAYLSQKIDQDMGNGIAAGYFGSTGGLGQAYEIAKGGGYEVGTAFLPKHDGRFGCPTGGSGIGIMRHASKSRKQACWQFIKFLARPENAAYWTVQTGYLPAVKAAQREPLLIKASKDPNYLTALKQLPRTKPQDLVRPVVSNAGDMMDQALTKLYSSDATVPDVFGRLDKQLRSRANLIMDDYLKHYT